jgi:hypothetical protein
MVNIFFCKLCHAIIDIRAEAAHRQTTELRIAQNIADNILYIDKGHGRYLDLGIQRAIINDHTQDHHRVGDSYFKSNSAEEIRNLIRFVIRDADSYNFYDRNHRYRLAIRKTLSHAEAQNLFHNDTIGYDERYREDRNHVIVCFDITGIDSMSDSTVRGAFLTAFPGREDQVCG